MAALALPSSALLGACSASPDKPPDDPGEDSIALARGIYDVARGQIIDEPRLLQDLAQARFVCLGEKHDSAEHHRRQLRVLDAMLKEHKGAVALGMEMFQRPFQQALDDYIAGAINEQQMLEGTQWKSRWGFGQAMYAPLWRKALSEGAPIVALNAPRELSRAIAKVGIEGLSEAQRDRLPEIKLEGYEDYRAWLREIFAAHGMDLKKEDPRFERFYQAQSLWDETMAQAAFEFMVARPKLRQMVLLTGGGHLRYGWGIPSRLKRRLPDDAADSIKTVLPLEQSATRADLKRWKADGLADYVWLSDPPAKKASPHPKT